MNKEKILIIEDEKPIADLLSYGLRQQGYETKMGYTASEGLEILSGYEPDLLLLDWMLPDCSGIDLCKMITSKYNIPIIMLTARSSMEDKILGLATGADDYITKPFELCEVVARVQTILRRIKRVEMKNETTKENALIVVNNISINRSARSILKDGAPIEVTPKEFDLLIFFLENPNIVFSRETLLDKIWNYDFTGDTRTVDTHVQRLRKKFDLHEQLQTVFRVGYKYVKN